MKAMAHAVLASFAAVKQTLSLSLIVALALCQGARAQAPCEEGWLPGEGVPGVDQFAKATTIWDPDGPGPQRALVVVGGSFTAAGSVPARYIAAWNPETGEWSALGNGPGGRVGSLAVASNGDLIAGGYGFTGQSGTASVARWNGATWSPVGTGLLTQGSEPVRTLAVMPNGDIVAGGWFHSSAAGPVNGIARWNGTSWLPLGAGVSRTNNSSLPGVLALAVMPNGDLIAGGQFLTAGTVTANYIARWDGATWSAMGPGFNDAVAALALTPSGDLFAGGVFTTPASGVAMWTGTGWAGVGGGIGIPNFSDHGAYALTVASNGDLVAGGFFFTAGGASAVPVRNCARWNGSAWSALGAGTNSPINALTALPNGPVISAGEFVVAGEATVRFVGQWDGAQWSSLGAEGGSYFSTLVNLPDGEVLASRLAAASEGGRVVYEAIRWDGRSWSAFGAGMNGPINTFGRLSDGDIVAGGNFAYAGDVNMPSIARWDGAAWSPMGAGLNAGVFDFATLPNGQLVAGGAFTASGTVPLSRIARWDGSAWMPLGTGINGVVSALLALSNGDLVVGGYFTTAGGITANRIARWNGTNWSPMGAGLNSQVNTLVQEANGDIVAGGLFTMSGTTPVYYVARWNGAIWSPVGTGFDRDVQTLHVLPNGDLLAAGGFTDAGPVAVEYVARWDGTAWAPLGTGTNDRVWHSAILPTGDLMVAGNFTFAGGLSSAYVATYSFGGDGVDIEAEPVPSSTCAGGDAVFEVSAAGTQPLIYAWQVEVGAAGSGVWSDLSDGAFPAATGSSAIASGTQTPLLTVTAADAAAATRYRAIVTNTCGSVTSDAATLTVCTGDYNCDGGVDGQDVEAFFMDWEEGLSRADVNRDGGVDGGDVEFFFVRWEAGC